MTTARDVMTKSVISVSPEASLLSVLRLFVEEDIHGAPVVDGEGRIVGSVTTSDLLRAQEDDHDTAWASSDYLRDVLDFSAGGGSGDSSDFQDRLAQRTVNEVMTEGAASVALDTPVAEVARQLRVHSIHRVWVEENGRLCGVISTLDLMSVIEKALAPR